jgi:hypothetical protein
MPDWISEVMIIVVIIFLQLGQTTEPDYNNFREDTCLISVGIDASKEKGTICILKPYARTASVN